MSQSHIFNPREFILHFNNYQKHFFYFKSGSVYQTYLRLKLSRTKKNDFLKIFRTKLCF